MEPSGNTFYFNTPNVASVCWDGQHELVLVEWEGWADSSEFSALLDAEISALRKHKGTRLLADCRRQKVINPADQERANREWVPRALAAGLKRFAVVLPSSVLAEMNLKQSLGKVPASELEVDYFATPEEARAWLAGK